MLNWAVYLKLLLLNPPPVDKTADQVHRPRALIWALLMQQLVQIQTSFQCRSHCSRSENWEEQSASTAAMLSSRQSDPTSICMLGSTGRLYLCLYTCNALISDSDCYTRWLGTGFYGSVYLRVITQTDCKITIFWTKIWHILKNGWTSSPKSTTTLLLCYILGPWGPSI